MLLVFVLKDYFSLDIKKISSFIKKQKQSKIETRKIEYLIRIFLLTLCAYVFNFIFNPINGNEVFTVCSDYLLLLVGKNEQRLS